MKKVISYHPELRDLIPSLGVESSSDLIRYLRNSSAPYTIIDRIYTSEHRIQENIDEMQNSTETDEVSFIFVMSVPDYDKVEILHLFGLSKDEMIKYIKLKVFS